MIKVAINGFGRIGRLVFRLMEDDANFEVVAINDITEPEQLAYLLKYDTSHKNYRVDEITYGEDYIQVGDHKIKICKELDPINLPWKELEIDEVFECTGKFVKYEDAHKHIEAGAKKVIISAPGKGDMKTIVYNVNSDTLDGSEEIISAASCTTNCLAPVAKVLDEVFGIEKGFMTTVHAYTNDQTILDVAHKKGIKARRGRAGAANQYTTRYQTVQTARQAVEQRQHELDSRNNLVGYYQRHPGFVGGTFRGVGHFARTSAGAFGLGFGGMFDKDTMDAFGGAMEKMGAKPKGPNWDKMTAENSKATKDAINELTQEIRRMNRNNRP